MQTKRESAGSQRFRRRGRTIWTVNEAAVYAVALFCPTALYKAVILVVVPSVEPFHPSDISLLRTCEYFLTRNDGLRRRRPEL